MRYCIRLCLFVLSDCLTLYSITYNKVVDEFFFNFWKENKTWNKNTNNKLEFSGMTDFHLRESLE